MTLEELQAEAKKILLEATETPFQSISIGNGEAYIHLMNTKERPNKHPPILVYLAYQNKMYMLLRGSNRWLPASDKPLDKRKR